MSISPRGSKAKGSNYEREIAKYFNEKLKGYGIEASRALLSGGGRSTGGADVIGLPFIHIEAKRTERFQPYKAMEQAEEAIKYCNPKNYSPVGLQPYWMIDPNKKPYPVVINRKNHVPMDDSLVVMRLKDWIDFYTSHIAVGTL